MGRTPNGLHIRKGKQSQMKKIALCIFTDNLKYNPGEDVSLDGLDYELFVEYNSSIFRALRDVSIKKRTYEMNMGDEFDACIAYNPSCANIADLKLCTPEKNKVYYAYGAFNAEQYIGAAEPWLFYSGTVEFNRCCEFAENYFNIQSPYTIKMSEKFLFHIRSLYLESECVNYENSSLFIRPT